jgi:hypothetical protein
MARQRGMAGDLTMVGAVLSFPRCHMTDAPGWHITGDWFDKRSCAVA